MSWKDWFIQMPLTSKDSGKDLARYFLTVNTKLDEIITLLKAVTVQEKTTMSAISDAVAALTAEAATIGNTEDSALTVLNGIKNQLAAAIANAADATAAVASVNQIVAALDAHNVPLAAAIAAPATP